MSATDTAEKLCEQVLDSLELEQPLHIKHRPTDLDDVIGQNHVTNSLRSLLKRKDRPHTFLFTGPSGTGKTTLARIIAKEVGCLPACIQELDAGTEGAVENIRELMDKMGFYPPKGDAKVLILDECHVLSKAAWNAVLKSTEDVPEHAYYIFATTEPGKVPATIRTRAHTYELHPVPSEVLFTYASVIAEFEGIKFSDDSKTNDEYIKLIATEAQGSPRQMLVYLSAARAVKSIDELRKLLASASASEDNPLIQIARLLVKGENNWREYATHLSKVESWGGAKEIFKSYVGKVMLSQGSYRLAVVLDAIDKMPPYPTEAGGLADVCLMLARCTMSKQ